jgi:FtsZ-interacting cell division protein ZipA
LKAAVCKLKIKITIIIIIIIIIITIIIMGHWSCGSDKGNQKPCSGTSLSTTSLTQNGLELNPGLHGERSVMKRMNHGIACSTTKLYACSLLG